MNRREFLLVSTATAISAALPAVPPLTKMVLDIETRPATHWKVSCSEGMLMAMISRDHGVTWEREWVRRVSFEG